MLPSSPRTGWSENSYPRDSAVASEQIRKQTSSLMGKRVNFIVHKQSIVEGILRGRSIELRIYRLRSVGLRMAPGQFTRQFVHKQLYAQKPPPPHWALHRARTRLLLAIRPHSDQASAKQSPLEQNFHFNIFLFEHSSD